LETGAAFPACKLRLPMRMWMHLVQALYCARTSTFSIACAYEQRLLQDEYQKIVNGDLNYRKQLEVANA
jgi:hypothetical protein